MNRNQQVKQTTSNQPPSLEMDEVVEEKQQRPRFDTKTIEELKEKLEIARHIDEIQENLECCLCPNAKTDRRLVILLSQILISSFIVLFCFYKLSNDSEQDDNKIYITLLTSIFSYWSGKSTNSESRN